MNDPFTEDLIFSYLEGSLDREGCLKLQDCMRADPEVRALYIEHTLLAYELDHLAEERLMTRSLERKRFSRRGDSRRQASVALAVAAVFLIAGAAVAWLIQVRQSPLDATMRFSANSEWSLDGGDLPTANGSLPFGQVLQVETGVVEITPAAGVIGIIEAPARIVVVDGGRLRLERGRGSFLTSEEGVGFTVVTPCMEVVDLGTEFGVVADWGRKDQVHVIKGSVEVSAPDGGVPQLLRKGDAVSVDLEGRLETIAVEERLFHRTLPKSVQVLATDDFEIQEGRDGLIVPGDVPGWKRIGSTGMVGRFNPDGRGRFYEAAEMRDAGVQGGVLEGMAGPSLGYLSGVRDGGLERPLGEIRSGCVYTVSLSLGVRGNPSMQYAGYKISFRSGDKVLESIHGAELPCEKDSFRTVTLSWNSKDLPEGINEGDPLVVRIGPYEGDGVNSSRGAYLDFDHFRASVSTPTE
jgi:hypothetical protein